MTIQAKVSMYPLRVKSLSEPIDEFCRTLRNNGLELHTGSMSTFIIGESQIVFQALERAFKKLAKEYDVVMEITISNACPQSETESHLRKG